MGYGFLKMELTCWDQHQHQYRYYGVDREDKLDSVGVFEVSNCSKMSQTTYGISCVTRVKSFTSLAKISVILMIRFLNQL